MNSDDLTPRQLRAIDAKLRPMADYLTRLRKRMDNRGFADTDSLLRLTQNAESATQLLHADIQCRMIDGRGIEIEPTPQPPPTMGKSKRSNSAEYLRRMGRD